MKSLLLIMLLICSPRLQAEEAPSKLQLHGYVKNLETVTMFPVSNQVNLDLLLHNRLNLSYASGRWQARLEFRNRLFVGDQVRSYPRGAFTDNLPNDQGLAKPWWDWSNGNAHAGFSEIDRYQLRYATEKFALTLGRQRIHWGVTNFWNANDLFNAYNFLDVDYEERAGREAVRLQLFSSGSAGWEFVYAPSRRSGMQTGGLLRKFHVWDYDLQLLAAWYQRDVAIGGAWAGSLGQTGFKGEATWFKPVRSEDAGSERLVFSSGIDRTLEGSWYVQGGILLNLLGDEPVEMQQLSNFNLSAKQLSPYRFNVLAGCTKTITPILQAGLTVWYAPDHQSVLLFPTCTWNAAQNLDVDLWAQALYSDRLGDYRSEGAAVTGRIRWSF